jgi:hypothetical protein
LPKVTINFHHMNVMGTLLSVRWHSLNKKYLFRIGIVAPVHVSQLFQGLDNTLTI